MISSDASVSGSIFATFVVTAPQFPCVMQAITAWVPPP